MLARIVSTPQRIFALLCAACAALIGYGLYLQHVQNLEPCPLCILQRYAFIGCGIVALIAAVHRTRRYGHRLYAATISLIALTGAGIAMRQIWLQHNPPQSVTCGPDLAYMLNSFPLTRALPMLFRGEGDCAKVDWTFLGLSIAQWALAWFALIALASLYVMLARRFATWQRP